MGVRAPRAAYPCPPLDVTSGATRELARDTARAFDTCGLANSGAGAAETCDASCGHSPATQRDGAAVRRDGLRCAVVGRSDGVLGARRGAPGLSRRWSGDVASSEAEVAATSGAAKGAAAGWASCWHRPPRSQPTGAPAMRRQQCANARPPAPARQQSTKSGSRRNAAAQRCSSAPGVRAPNEFRLRSWRELWALQLQRSLGHASAPIRGSSWLGVDVPDGEHADLEDFPWRGLLSANQGCCQPTFHAPPEWRSFSRSPLPRRVRALSRCAFSASS